MSQSSRVAPGHGTPSAARFDAALGAYVLSRHADVSAALLDSRIVPQHTSLAGAAAHVDVRSAASHVLLPEVMAGWCTTLAAHAWRMVEALPAGQPVDLVASLARPWSLDLAIMATGVSRTVALEAVPLARQLYLSAATATAGETHPAAQAAASQLARLLSNASARPGASADVQAFVALSQTLPSLLSSAWLALLQHPGQLAKLRDRGRVTPPVIAELLRYAGPARAVFREAGSDLDIGGVHIRAGDAIVLLLSAASRDPARFPEPDRLDIDRVGGGHLAFGAGTHGCVGAPLVHMATGIATEALVRRTSALELVGGTEAVLDWTGGFAILAPGALPVVVQRTSDPAGSTTQPHGVDRAGA